MTYKQAKRYILENWFDGDENADAVVGGDTETMAMKCAVKALERADVFEKKSTSMTNAERITELKEEAKQLGYTLRKIQPYTKLLPCKCGGKKRLFWYNYVIGGFTIQCYKCGVKTERYKTQEAAKIAWNNMMMENENDKR